MIQIVDALQCEGEDGLLRYWGFSYGTVLGATVAAMFPDKMDKVILDGNVNLHEYYGGGLIEQATDSDKVFSGLTKGCFQKPANCALTQDSSSAEDLEAKTYALIQQLREQPLVAGPNIAADIISYPLIKSLITGALYTPSIWPQLAVGLHDLFAGNLTGFQAIATAALTPKPPVYPSYGPEAVWGIYCSDVAPHTNDLNSLRPLGEGLSEFEITCLQWPFAAKERPAPDTFRDVRTRRPLLIIGNTYDPVTPLVSARNTSASFPGSVLLQHDGYGVSRPTTSARIWFAANVVAPCSIPPPGSRRCARPGRSARTSTTGRSRRPAPCASPTSRFSRTRRTRRP